MGAKSSFWKRGWFLQLLIVSLFYTFYSVYVHEAATPLYNNNNNNNNGFMV